MTNKHSQQHEIGMVGLDVMGCNLALNMPDHGCAMESTSCSSTKFTASSAW
jgi:6-phosphogluconate dehydrogenase